MEEIYIEIIWERYSEVVETLRGDSRHYETVMSKTDFMKAAAELLRGASCL